MATSPALQEARENAARSAKRAQVVVRPLTETDDLADVEALLAAVWQHPPGSVEVDITLLVALARSGHYVVGAFRDEQLVGATVAFRSEPFPVTLYSHVTGVDRERAAPGTGTALKDYQRVWCLERGITNVRWTFDALQARNARLNIHRLGAQWLSFHPDYYGQLRDGLNRDVGSDRLLVQWDLTQPRGGGEGPDRVRHGMPTQTPVTILARGPAQEPVTQPVPEATCRVEIPTDIDDLRASDPGSDQQWRDALREILTALIASGRQVVDFDDGGAYVVAPANTPPEEATR